MTKLAEDSQWIRGKRVISKEYLQAFGMVERAVAGRGFLHRPGYLGGVITDLEADSKFKLSELNYEIVAQAIERELAQTGHSYDIAYKTALIAWELERVTTLTALDQEFAALKKDRALDMFALDKLEIETNLRKLVIIATKAQIKTDLEALDQEMVEIGRLTFSAETTLMNAKRLTASKKLEVIPYIETILVKQQELIGVFTDNVTRKEALITAKELVIGKKEELITAKEGISDKFTDLIAIKEELITAKETISGKFEDLIVTRADLLTAKEAIAGKIAELISAREGLITAKEAVVTAKESLLTQETATVAQITALSQVMERVNEAHQRVITAKKALLPYMYDKATAQQAYAAEVSAWIIVKEAIATVKEEIAVLKEIEGDNRALIMAEKAVLNGLELSLQSARINLRVAKLTGHTTITDTRISELTETLTKEQTVLDRELDEDSTMISKRLDAAVYAEDKAFQTITDVDDILIPSEKDMIDRIATARIEELEETSDIASGAELTSELIHLIG